MKITKKIIEGMGGTVPHYLEGGGCIFCFKHSDLSILDTEMPQDVKSLVHRLLELAYEKGMKDGRKDLEDEFKSLLGL